MKIIDIAYNWAKSLSGRPRTDMIVLHHRAGTGDALSIHNEHVKKGWAGIGYHFYVRKDGTIYRGRPIDKMGAHVEGHNDHTVGICFEGNFEKEIMTKGQLESGRALIKHINEGYYRELPILRHSDIIATVCPGKNFPYEDMVAASLDKIVNKMYSDGVITKENVANWEAFLSGRAKVRVEYVRRIIARYQKLL